MNKGHVANEPKLKSKRVLARLFLRFFPRLHLSTYFCCCCCCKQPINAPLRHIFGLSIRFTYVFVHAWCRFQCWIEFDMHKILNIYGYNSETNDSNGNRRKQSHISLETRSIPFALFNQHIKTSIHPTDHPSGYLFIFFLLFCVVHIVIRPHERRAR